MSRSENARGRLRINWVAVVLAVVIGVVYFGVWAANGDIVPGLIGLGIMLAIAGGLAIFGGRSDTVALLGDDRHDERHVHIHQRAALATLNILALVIVGAFVVNIARGGTGEPYSWLAAVGGATYVAFLLVLGRRS